MEIDNDNRYKIYVCFKFWEDFNKFQYCGYSIIGPCCIAKFASHISFCLLRAPLNRFDILYTRECFISIMVFRLMSPQTKLSYQTGKLTLTLIRHDTQKRPSQQRTIFYSLDMSIIKKQQSLLIMTVYAKWKGFFKRNWGEWFKMTNLYCIRPPSYFVVLEMHLGSTEAY